MATSAVTKTACARGTTGHNLTDGTFHTLSTGAGNGGHFAHLPTDVIVLKNDTGGDAVFTFKLNDSAITTAGGTVTNPTKTIATGKTWVLRLDDIFKNASGNIVIECDVAGKVLVYTMP